MGLTKFGIVDSIQIDRLTDTEVHDSHTWNILSPFRVVVTHETI